MELAEADLVEYVRTRLGRVAVAAFEEEEHNTSLPGRLDCANVTLFKLNAFSHIGSPLRKLFNYAYAVLAIPLPLLRNNIAYIFCPGHCAAIASIWTIILRRPYGLYVRGTWLSPDGRTSWIWKHIFKNASFIIATGEAFRRKLQNFNDNVENEVPLTKVANVRIMEKLIQRPPGIHKILFAGRLTESKGVLDLVKAVSIGRNEFSLDIELLIAGGGTADEEVCVQKLARECGISECVSLLGHVTEIEKMKHCYYVADTFVFPSYYREGFPRVLYEAMMYALPIITTDMPGTQDFLVDSKNCLICESRNPRDIARCIKRLSCDHGLALTIGKNAHSLVTEVFNGFRYPSHEAQLMALMKDTLCRRN